MTDEIKHFYHHKRCDKCGKYTVHDAGVCTICKEQQDIIAIISKLMEKPKKVKENE
jgi:uncharacterized OB-fold protein